MKNFIKLINSTEENFNNTIAGIENEIKTIKKLLSDDYYNEDIDYGEEPYGALCLYDFKSENVERKLTAQDIKLIENFVK